MATTQDYLTQLQNDKENLVNNLVEKGVEATSDETFTSLVPKVLDIQGGGDVNWAEIGYDGTPKVLKDAYEYAIDIKNNWVKSSTYSNRFSNDYLLMIMPLVDTSDGTNFYNMFNNCMSLKILPKIDTSKGTTFSNMFYYCSSLTEIPELDTSKGTLFSNMFYYCSSLMSVPELDTSNGTNFNSMFSHCSSLTEIPELDTSNGTNLGSMLYSCANLISVPELDTSQANNLSSLFANSKKIENLGGFVSLGKGYTNKSANYSSYILSLSSNTSLTYESLMNVINKVYDLNLTYNVANGGTLYTQKIELGSTNLAKLTAEEIAIATNKGWTVS